MAVNAPTTPPCRRTVSALLALALLLGAGCGLEDYEKRMDEEQVRLKYVDDEQKYTSDALGLPINLNAKDESEQPPLQKIQVFLLPPKRFSRTPEEKEVYVFGSTALYRYPGPEGYNLFLAGAMGELKAKQFQHEVRKALRTYSRALPASDESPSKPFAFQPFEARGEKVLATQFDSQELKEADTVKDAHRYALYFHRAEEKQIAVIFQVPLTGADQAVFQGIEYSLKSLGIGAAASRQQAAFSKRRALRKRP